MDCRAHKFVTTITRILTLRQPVALDDRSVPTNPAPLAATGEELGFTQRPASVGTRILAVVRGASHHNRRQYSKGRLDRRRVQRPSRRELADPTLGRDSLDSDQTSPGSDWNRQRDVGLRRRSLGSGHLSH